jgi:acetyl esterase/lipase
MRALRVASALAALGLLAAVPAPAAAGDPPVRSGGNYEVEVVRDLAYSDAKDADPVRHKLDLYLPKGHKDFPVLFFVHGGAWRAGSKEGFAKVGRMFARNGIGAVSTNYRLSPKVTHPAHIQDVARAFAWVHKNIGKYGGNKTEIFVSGHSAGGHLVALLATDPSYLEAEKLSLKDIKGAIPVSGVYRVGGGKMSNVFGKDEDFARKASPMVHVKGKHPPFLILVADNDLKGFDRMAEAFCKALGKVECKAEVLIVEDRNHGSVMFSMANQKDPGTQAVLAFIARHSRLKLTEAKAGKSDKSGD